MDTSLTSTPLSHSSVEIPAGGPLQCFRIFVSPVHTLASLKQRPLYFVALLIAATYGTAVNLWIVQRIGLQNVLASTVRASATVDADTMLANMLRYRSQILWTQSVSTFLGTFITAAVIALVLWLLVTVVGGEVPLKTVNAVVASVLLFTTVIKSTMFGLAVLFSRNAAAFNLRNPIATNAAFFFDTGSHFLQHVIRSFDVLSLTAVVLTIIGLRLVAARLSTFAASLIVVVPWAVYVVAAGLITVLS
jgi:hypothetical protein